MLQPIAYLTCEIKGRDFRPRLLIAAHLVKRGYSVVVGQLWNVGDNSAYAPKGCYHFKTANLVQADYMRLCKKRNHAVVATDEEAFSTSEALAAHTTDPKSMEYCDEYLALNAAHARSIKTAFPAHAGNVHVTGTARADLLRYAKYERPHSKPYALVNTSFGLLNGIWGRDAIDVYANTMAWDLTKPEHKSIMDARLDYEREALDETRKLISWLVESSGLDVVVRPHPGESPDMWRKIPGVTVVEKSDPYPWLKHATVMVHNDSTVGLEAAILGAPSLNLSPRDEWSSRLNVHEYNQTVRTAAEAIAAISSGKIETINADSLAPRNAAEATADRIAGLLPPPSPLKIGPWGTTKRTDIQRQKITVTADECVGMVREVFPISGTPFPKITQLEDTVFLFQQS